MQTKSKTSISNKNTPNERIGLKYCDKISINSENLSNIRIIKKNLVYVIGITKEMANKNVLFSLNILILQVLKKPEYFGQYGNILKVVINTTNAYKSNNTKATSHSAYITFSKPTEASIAILAVDGMVIGGQCIRATYGSTRFCAFYLKGKECTNKECLYLHSEASEYDEIMDKDDVNKKINFKQHQLQAIKIADIFNFEIRKKIITNKVVIKDSVLPNMSSIYENPVVYDNDLNYYKFEEFLTNDKTIGTDIKKDIISERESIYGDSSTLKATSSASGKTNELRSMSSKDSCKEDKEQKEEIRDVVRNENDRDTGNNSDIETNLNIKKGSCSSEEMTENKNKFGSIISSTTAESRDSLNAEKEATTPCVKLYITKENSRFNFTEENISDLGIEVPKFFHKIIYSKY